VSRLEDIEAKRAARKAASEAAADEQAATDLEAIDALEQEHGYSNVSVLKVAFVGESLPTRVAVRAPSQGEVKRFRTMVAARKVRGQDVPGDHVAASEMLGASCLVYPTRDVLEKLCEKRAGLLAQLGGVALQLAIAQDESEGNA
jgi:hypothetical protein